MTKLASRAFSEALSHCFFSRSRFQISWGGSLYFIFVFYFQICILFLKDQINPVLSPFSSFFVVFLAFLVASRVFPCSLARFAPPLSFFLSFSPLSFVFFCLLSPTSPIPPGKTITFPWDLKIRYYTSETTEAKTKELHGSLILRFFGGSVEFHRL